MSTEIYTVTHKLYEFPKDQIYKPIIAGAFEYEKDTFPTNYLRDDIGDNISQKHDLYSEFTVTYWMWKNSAADIIGLNHYRRYFIRGGWVNYFRCLTNPKKQLDKLVLNLNDILNIFQKKQYDCVMPKKQWRVNRTLREEFIDANSPELLNLAENIIKEKFPDYHSTFIDVMNSKENYQKCICIMKKSHFDRYADWIFSIFNELERNGVEGSNREYAFLGERLINVWVEYQKQRGNLKVDEHFFVNVEFSFSGILKNHTELFIPKLFIPFIKIINKMGMEAVIGHGHFKIQKRKGQG